MWQFFVKFVAVQTQKLVKCMMVTVMSKQHDGHISRAAQGAYLEVEYIRNVLSVSGTLKYADSGTA